jgi:hypothetical protein
VALNLASNLLSSLEGLAHMTSLRVLQLGRNQLHGLEPLQVGPRSGVLGRRTLAGAGALPEPSGVLVKPAPPSRPADAGSAAHRSQAC